MPDVDVLVVGAGPAGAVAAWQAKQAARELDVVLLERDRAVGAPVRCAEGVGDAGLREFVNPDGADWVSRRVTDVIFEAPDDTQVVIANSGLGWILDRTRFDAFLAAQAAAEGAAVLVGAEATAMARDGDERWHVRVKQRGTEEIYRARIVIGADGVETMVGRWAGLETRVPARDMGHVPSMSSRGSTSIPTRSISNSATRSLQAAMLGSSQRDRRRQRRSRYRGAA
jgi:digeranylgeranylglycerophospholipid reductase